MHSFRDGMECAFFCWRIMSVCRRRRASWMGGRVLELHIKGHRSGFPFGMTWITSSSDGDAGYGIDMGVLRLEAGHHLTEAVECETAWLLMEGEVELEVDNGAGPQRTLLVRRSLFDESPSGLHVGAGCRVSLRARGESEFTVYRVPNGRCFDWRVFREVPDEHRGKGLSDDACYRLVRTILSRDTTPLEAELVLGEVVTQPGRWAGFPPHQHPQPEIYHYRFSRPQGFGYSEVGGQIFRVEHCDTVKIACGQTHPQVAAPGYAMYFSWVIRHLPSQPYLKPTFAIGHTWITRQDARVTRPAALRAPPPTPSPRRIDLICLGRVAVDLYGEQIGAELESVASFARYIGGCAGNVAVGTARLGLRSAMLSRVGDEQMGRFVRDTLIAEGVDVRQLSVDPQRMTGLAILSIRSREDFPLLFYRDNCADMGLEPTDLDPDFISSARALLVTGTHLSTPATAEVTRTAIAMARSAGTLVVLDIDYRPVLWGLTGKGEGDKRYVACEPVSRQLLDVVGDCDLVVGTEEEFHIAAGAEDTLSALRVLRSASAAVFVVKHGAAGCSIYSGDIGENTDAGLRVAPAQIEVLNVLGAGDAFISGFLRGWLLGEPLERCGMLANLNGALVASRHGCAPAMPSLLELEACLARSVPLSRPDDDPKVAHLHRVHQRRGAWPELMVLAFDHRKQFEMLVERTGRGRDRIPPLKQLIAQAAVAVAISESHRTGVLVDGRYGAEALMALAGRGMWIGRPVEKSGSRPLAFEAGMNVGLDLHRWPREQTVKCLLRLDLEDPADLREIQEQRIVGLQEACQVTGHELMLEVLPPDGARFEGDELARALARFYELGVRPDWWKLGPQSEDTWHDVEKVIVEHDAHCRGILLAGVDASVEELARDFAMAACRPLIRGFAVGRTIWGDPCKAWLEGSLDSDGVVAAVESNYRKVIGLWRECRLSCQNPTLAVR